MCNHESTINYVKKYELKNGKQLIVKVPEISEAQALIDYMKEVDCETRFLAREPGEFAFTVEQEVAFISSLSEDQNSQLLIAEIDGQIVANCSVGIVMNNLRYLHRAALGISVRESYWGQGIGTILMKECINWCIVHSVEQLELEVITQNVRAIELYKKLGFEKYGTKKNALKYSDGTYADEYYMIKFIER